jgi:hypothetical protein
MNSLALQKQLLVAESELNRAQLKVAMAEIKSGVHYRVHHGASISEIATAAAVLALDVTATPSIQKSVANSKHRWLKGTLKGAALISTVWLAFQAQKED